LWVSFPSFVRIVLANLKEIVKNILRYSSNYK
jgi:hypothetical protein